MIKIVVDTNVLVSGLLNDTGAPAKLILRWLQGQFDLIISKLTFEEYEYVLARLSQVNQDKVSELLDEVRASALQVMIHSELRVCKDPQDDKFLETAIVGDADFLVTKNLKHFPAKSFQNVRIVKISTILSELEKLYPE